MKRRHTAFLHELLIIVVVCLGVSILSEKISSCAMEQQTNSQSESITETNENFSLDELRRLNGGELDILFDRKTNVPRFIDGKFTTIKILTTEEAIRSLNSVRNIFKLDNPADEFICVKSNKDGDSNVFTLQQVYKGVEVYGRQLIVISRNDGESLSLSGDYMPGIYLNVTPTIQENDARKIAFGTQKAIKIRTSRLVIYINADSASFLCWVFNVQARNVINDSIVFVDARTGEIIEELSNSYSFFFEENAY